MQNSALLHCHALCKSYGSGALLTPVLRGISLAITAGEMVALVGRSGSGKSTLLHLLGGLETPSSGTIFFQQQALHHLSSKAKALLRNRSLGFIYQFHHLLPDFDAVENVAMPLLIAGLSGVAARRQAEALLVQVGLEQRFSYRPATLSGGERQRVAIARALINRPALVLADEPTGDLDQHNTHSIFTLLTKLNKEYGTAFLVVTHDLTLANHFQRQLTLYDGELVASEHPTITSLPKEK